MHSTPPTRSSPSLGDSAPESLPRSWERRRCRATFLSTPSSSVFSVRDPSYDMMQECDTLLMVGTNFPYSEFLPPTGQARGVQIDLLPRHLSLRYPMEVNLWGDAKTTLAALLAYLEPTEDLAWQQDIAESMTSLGREPRSRGDDEGRPGQSPPRVPHAQRTTPRRRDRHRRRRHHGRLVWPSHQTRTQHDGQSLGPARDDVGRDARTRSRRNSRFPNGQSSARSATAHSRCSA